MTNAHFVATLSDGTTATEHHGEWQIIPGQRKPWVRLIEKLATEEKHLTSLRLNIDGRTIHLPRPGNNRFESHPPLYYSLCYRFEADDILGDTKERHFIDIAAHYGDFAVHSIHDLTDGKTSWICVTGPEALAPSPKPREAA